MTVHPVVSPDEWVEARTRLLQAEKEHTRAKDRLSEARRQLPWVRIDKHYVFEGPDGEVTLEQLFEGRSQLVVQHFMFAPEWDEGCVGCSFQSDHVDDAFQHLYHHDVSFVAISRAPYPRLAAFKERMGWKFNWVSSHSSDFNRDFGVSITDEDVASGQPMTIQLEMVVPDEPGELPAISVFLKDDDGAIYQTYSSDGVTEETLINTYNLLDIAPLGRNEPGGEMSWIRHHDSYASS
jgi:predicted dithiol-disulfide oxidoreductase (DUF899 family)